MKKRLSDTPAYYDIAIIGGGPAGLTMAAALIPLGYRVALIERAPFPPQLKPAFDGRTTAIAWQGYQLLQDIGIWPALAPLSSPIHKIRVADQHTPHVLDFDSAELNVGPFGYIVENRFLRAALLKQLRSSPNVTFYNPATVTALDNSGDVAQLTLDNGNSLQAALVVAADGRASPIRQLLNIDTFGYPYDTHAIVCTVQGSHPHGQLALEHFLPDGPFAVLPMTENRASIVWSMPPAMAKAVLALNNDDFKRALLKAGASYMGEIELISDRFSYPLSLTHARTYSARHVVLLGEAAHGIHPIAGQGFNLGLRDIECLCDLLRDAQKRGLRADDPSVVEAYERVRRRDNQRMIAATDILDRVFSTDLPVFSQARQWSLSLINKVGPWRRFFMRQAMGYQARQAKAEVPRQKTA